MGNEARSFAQFRKQMSRDKLKKTDSALNVPVYITLTHGAGPERQQHGLECGTDGTVDMPAVEALFGLEDAWLEHPPSGAGGSAGGVVVTVTGGASYAVRGQPRVSAAALPCPPRRVGFGSPDAALRHAPQSAASAHPERPARVRHTLDMLGRSSVREHLTALDCTLPVCAEDLPDGVHSEGVLSRVVPATRRPAYPGRLYEQQVATTTYLESLNEHNGGDSGPELPEDTYTNEHTGAAVQGSLGTVFEACDKVLGGELDNAFCLVRPPGHHCTCAQPQGFCHVNNVALAARRAQRGRPGGRRVAIVDFDVHHGNGTQQIFEEDDTVLFVSLHRHDDGKFYPNTGAVEECGTGAGVGYTVNVPFDTRPGTAEVIGDTAFEVAMTQLVVPLLEDWKPDLVLASAGFDAAAGDPLGKMNVHDGFARATAQLRQACPRLVMVLEGGYNTESVAQGVLACLRSLCGVKPPALDEDGEQARWAGATLRRVVDSQLAAGSPFAGVLGKVREGLVERAAAAEEG